MSATLGPGRAPFVGVISDTHGKLRPEALAALAGASLVLHGGDVGGPGILRALAAVAPVHAVRGNNDDGAGFAGWEDGVPETRVVAWAGLRILVVHDAKTIPEAERRAGYDVVVSGHSHKPGVELRDGTLWLNPGSAGPRRFKLPVTVARLYVEDGAPRAEIVELAV